MPADAVEVGRVMGAWGIKGGIRIKPYAADPQALFASRRWFIQPPETPRLPGIKASVLPAMLRVVTAKAHGDGVVATAQELGDRSAAEAMRGARIFVPRTSFPSPDEGEFYWVDLIGLGVVNRQGVALGTVVGLMETGPHCVLRIQPADAKAEEMLMPFVDAYVDGVDLVGHRIDVDWDAETGVDPAADSATEAAP